MASVIGQRVRRREDPRFLLGQGQYVDDLELTGALHCAFVRSPWAHAHVNGVDGSAAAALDGVQVFTADDIDLDTNAPPPMIPVDPRTFRRFVARDRVRFAGDIVAVVLAETREAAVDAAELVDVDYDPLPVVTDMRDAARDEVLLYEDLGSNICIHQPPDDPDAGLFDGCEVVVKGTLHSQRMAVAPLEPRATAAQPGDDGRLTVWLSTQTPHQDRDGIAGALGLEPGQVRVVAPDVGGGFGGKGLAVEDVVIAWLARDIGRTVRWTETRGENLVAMNQGRAQLTDFELGGSRDGRIEALRLSILQDAGAYPGIGAFLPQLTAMMSSGVYDIPKIEVDVKVVVTNATPVAAYRGAGRPEAAQIVERAVDAFAIEIGRDPAEVRRRNFIAADAFPFTTVTGATYDCGDYGRALDLALQHAGYEQLRAEQAERRANGDLRLLGIGLSVYVEITNGFPEGEFGAVEITPDGGAIVRTGSFSHGQGHETTFAQIASARLGIPVERITVLKGDTDSVARGTGTYGSKSTQIGGVAAGKASEEVVDRAKRIAADELEANPDDMLLDVDTGAFHVAGSREPSLAWGELASRLQTQDRLSELSAEVDFQPEQPTFPFGAHLAVVEVDTETGAVEVRRIVAVDDAGTIINPLVADGQVHGGLAAGIGQALYEEITYDEDGNPQNSTFVTYGFPGPAELPSFDRVQMETPTPVNPLGAKGIGESATIGSTPAVLNAVLDALAPLGVRELQMPVNGERVWRAIRDADGAREQ
jgi:carbon-monoxide dehydrogenase large subunit